MQMGGFDDILGLKDFSGSTQPNLSDFKTDFEKAEYLKAILISRCTNGSFNDDHYKKLRRHFLNQADTKDKVPDWVRTNTNMADFWQFIKPKLSTYDERRKFINEEFAPFLNYLESGHVNPHFDAVEEGLKVLSSDDIARAWTKALERKDTDPDGAITIAKSLVESVLKHILDERKITYSKDADLPDLYKSVAAELNLSASQHTEDLFRQILGSCAGVVTGLSRLRNTMGDAHGKGKVTYHPAARHAELAVNLAGTMCLFILRTYESKILGKA